MRLQLFFSEFKVLVLAAVLIWWSLQLQLSIAGTVITCVPTECVEEKPRAHVADRNRNSRSRRLGPRPSRETDWRRDVALLTSGSSGGHTHTHTVSVAHAHTHRKCCSSSCLKGHQHHHRTHGWTISLRCGKTVEKELWISESSGLEVILLYRRCWKVGLIN